MLRRRKSSSSVVLSVLACCSCLLLLQRVEGQSASEAESGLVNAAAVAFNAATGKVYTVDTDRNAVHVTNDATGSTIEVPVGAGPVSIAVDASNGRAYVASAGDGTVTVVDGKTDVVIATLTVGSHPYSIAADSDAGKIYVSRTYSNELTVIDAATNAISEIKSGSPDLISVDTKTHTAFLLGYEGGDLTVLNEETRAFQKTSVGMHAWGMAVNDKTGALYVARPGYAEVAVLELGSMTPTLIAVGQIPCSVAINSTTNRIYVANYADNTASVIDGAKPQVITTIPVGARPQAVAADAVRNLVFVANTQGNSVTVIDGLQDKVIATLKAGKAPYALAINPASGKLHVANEEGTAFTILDVSQLGSKPQ